MSDYDGKCTYLLDACRRCKRYFRRDERYLNCPDCGEPRKCGLWAYKPYKLCQLHGGKPNLKAKYEPQRGRAIVTGKNSKSIIANLASKYLEETKNGALITNRASLRIIDDRIASLLERIGENDSPERIKKIIVAWNNFKTSMPNLKTWVRQDKDALKAYNSIEAEVDKAYHDYESWNQVLNTLDLRRKLTEGEMKILEKMQALISAEDAEELVAQLLAAVIKVLGDVPDGAKYIKAIHYEFARITGEPDIDRPGNRGGEVIEVKAVTVD